MFDTKYGKEEAEEEDAEFFNEAHVNRIYIVMIAIFSGFKALPLLKLSLLFRQRYHFNYSFLNCTGRWKCGTISLTQKYYSNFVYSSVVDCAIFEQSCCKINLRVYIDSLIGIITSLLRPCLYVHTLNTLMKFIIKFWKKGRE